MLRFPIYLAAFLLLLGSACDRTAPSDKDVVGTWEWSSMDATGRMKFDSDHRVVQWWVETSDGDAVPATASVGTWRIEGPDVAYVLHNQHLDAPQPEKESKIPLTDFSRRWWFPRPGAFRRIK